MTSLPSKDNIRDIILEMKDEFISRDAIEKLQSLQPTSEEVNNIRNAHQRNLEIPLGTAEQYLLGRLNTQMNRIFTLIFQCSPAFQVLTAD